MFNRVAPLAVAVMIGIVAGSGRPAAAPQPQPDVLNALLLEVRGLRAAMEDMASSGPRVQLAFGRLQLQEQRINAILRRHEAVREHMVAAAKEDGEARTRVETYQKALRDNANGEEREQLVKMMPEVQREAARLAAVLQDLQNEESNLSLQITSEQGRWAEINRNLEELERSLVRR